MNTPTPHPHNELIIHLRGAWLQKLMTAAGTLGKIRQAPALFKPEYVAQVEAEHDRALAQVRYFGRGR